jgi:PKD repeat protein
LELPTADFGYTGNGLEFQFQSMATGAVSVSWNFGDGGMSTVENPTHTYGTEDTYDVTLTVYGVCDTVTAMQSVDVTLTPQAGFTTDVSNGCAPLVVQFTDASTGSVDTYAWTFEGGNPATSTDANPTVTYETPGVYDVTLVVSNASGSNTLVINDHITVGGLPDASFTSDVSNDSVSFTNTSVDATAYSWTFGDGSTSNMEHPIYAYGASGTWDVTLIATNACGSDTFNAEVVDVPLVESELEVSIYPVPADEFIIVDLNGPFFGNHQLRIIDMLGRTVQSINIDKGASEHQVQLTVSELAAATYFVEITSNDLRVVRKVVIE